MSLVGRKINQFRILEQLGSGGSAHVYVGFDEILQREVALKAVRGRRRLKPEARLRFRREARILSRLEHPNICRIYELVEGPDRDYLVLELLRGRTLRQALEEGLDPALRMVVARQIGRALVAAHAKGIIHRDLKPENIVLVEETAGAAQGKRPARIRAKVLDFGLAQSRADAMGGQEGSDGDSTSTSMGSLQGTAAYMSPEQAQGEPVTLTTDLFTFGLLLQEIFTGQRAYPGDLEFPALLMKVALGETVPVTGVDSDLAALIETLKSIRPEDRGTAAEALARLGWIRDKPQRRRRRFLAAAAIVAALTFGWKYAFDLHRERTAAWAARDAAVQARDQAENLVAFMLEDLSAELEPIGRLGLLRQVAHKTLDYYEAVPELEESAWDRRGIAFRQLGEVLWAQGDSLRATRAIERARDIHQRLTDETPQELEYRSHLAHDEQLLGALYRAQGNLANALVAFQHAEEIHRELIREEPENGEWKHALAEDLSGISFVLDSQGKRQQALELLQQVREILLPLVDDTPEHQEWTYALAVNYNHIGSFLEQKKDAQGALTAYQNAKELSENLLANDPTNRRWQLSLALDMVTVAFALEAFGKKKEALAELRQATELSRRLVEADPTNVNWQYRYAICHSSMGEMLQARGDLEGALQAFQEARAISLYLMELDPHNTDWQHSLAYDNFSVGTVLELQGNLNAATAALEVSQQLYEDLVVKDKSRADWRDELSNVEGQQRRVMAKLASKTKL